MNDLTELKLLLAEIDRLTAENERQREVSVELSRLLDLALTALNPEAKP